MVTTLSRSTAGVLCRLASKGVLEACKDPAVEKVGNWES